MSVYGSVFFLLLILSYAATQSTNLSECGPIEESTLCTSLGGRTSNYITPPNLPPDIQLSIASVAYSDPTLRLLLEQTESPEACYEFAIHQLCLVVAPPCNPNTSAPLLLCPETCLAYDRLIWSGLCDSYVDEIIQTLEKSLLNSFMALANRFRVFNCSDPSTYFQNRTAEVYENSSCTNLFSPNTQESIMSMESLFSCVPVSGSPCQAWFPGTFTSAILVPGRGEKEEDIFITLAKVSPSLGDTCSQWLNFIACNYLHPPCNENGEQVVLCEGECEVIARVFLEGCSIAEILETLNITEMSYTFLNRQQQVDCSDSDIPTVPVDNSSCLSATHLLSIDENDTPLRDVYIGAIVGGAVLGLLVVLLTVALIVLCTRTRARQKMVMSQDVLGHLTLSQRVSQGIGRTLGSHQHRNGRLERGESGYKEGQEVVLRLPERELKELQLQFAGSIVQFTNLTMDTENCLGQGAFGKVYSGDMELRGIRTKVAIKTIKRISTEDQLQSFLAESLIMKDFKHPHVLGLLGVCFDTPDNSPYIILPFMANGSVKTFLRAKRVHPTNFDDCPLGLKLGDLVQMCMDIAEGMKYLTDNKFVHRDLAARNCMVNEECTVLVGDFGLARDIYTAEYYRKNSNGRLPVKWMPPETLNDGISNEKTDVWSYGVTCWEVFSLGRSPYPGIENHEILQHISSGGRLNKPTLCPDKLYTLLLQCWSPLPEDRPSFTELCVLLKEYWDDEHLYVVQSFQER